MFICHTSTLCSTLFPPPMLAPSIVCRKGALVIPHVKGSENEDDVELSNTRNLDIKGADGVAPRAGLWMSSTAPSNIV
jgi:hypothetical protein